MHWGGIRGGVSWCRILDSIWGSKTAQNLMLVPNLLSDYVGYSLNLSIFNVFWVGLYSHDSAIPSKRRAGSQSQVSLGRPRHPQDLEPAHRPWLLLSSGRTPHPTKFNPNSRSNHSPRTFHGVQIRTEFDAGAESAIGLCGL